MNLKCRGRACTTTCLSEPHRRHRSGTAARRDAANDLGLPNRARLKDDKSRTGGLNSLMSVRQCVQVKSERSTHAHNPRALMFARIARHSPSPARVTHRVPTHWPRVGRQTRCKVHGRPYVWLPCLQMTVAVLSSSDIRHPHPPLARPRTRSLSFAFV